MESNDLRGWGNGKRWTHPEDFLHGRGNYELSKPLREFIIWRGRGHGAGRLANAGRIEFFDHDP